MTAIARIGIAGGGAWGTALALVALRAGTDVTVWARESHVVDSINSAHTNPFLPAATLPPDLRATGDLTALAACDAVLLAPPAQHMREVCAALALSLGLGTPLVVCAKGIEAGTGALLSEVVAETLPGHPVAVLSGPTFAAEVARGLPTAVTLATTDSGLAKVLVAALGAPEFRPYAARDLVGAQVGGAVKNVLAIACGIVTGRNLGDNARSALVTRGLAEMLRLGVALGADAATLMGLSGLGDLVLTCSSAQSRNMSLGIALGRGEALADVLDARTSVTEGVATSAAIVALSSRTGVELPISAAVDSIVNRGEPIDGAIRGLLERPFRAEGDD